MLFRSNQSVLAQQRLRELILAGELAPGLRLLEVTLAERLGVSRTPVRTALVRLEQEGLLDSLPAGTYTSLVGHSWGGDTAAEIADTGTSGTDEVRFTANGTAPAIFTAKAVGPVEKPPSTAMICPVT